MKDETGASAIDRGIAQDEMFLIQLNNMQQNKQSKIFEGENSSLKKTFDSAVEYGRVIEEVVEKGADLEHDRWSGWQKYLHSLCVKNEDGTLTIPKERVERWERQIATPYSELSEQEKEYDRIEVRKYQDIFNHIHSLGITQGIEMVEKALPEERKVNYQSLSTGEIRNNVGFNTALSQIKDIISKLK